MTISPKHTTRIEFPPVGRCIYCGRSDCELTLEHIIPEALNGILELPDASCRRCQEIINSYEWTVGRWIFGDFRIRYNLRSKRSKSRRPKTIDIDTIAPDGSMAKETVSRSYYPAPLFYYKFGRASILRNLPPGTGIFEWVPYAIQDEAAMAAFEAKHPKAVFKLRTAPFELARMLAKIGYSYAVAKKGLGTFDPFQETLDTILCKSDDVAFTVGSDMKEGQPMPDEGHILSLTYLFSRHRPPLLITEVRLFAALPTPTFDVVVGQINLKNPQHVAAIPQEVRDAQAIKPL